MKEKVIIFHGTDCTPDSYWQPWLKEQLMERGMEVQVPSYPGLNHDPISKTLAQVLEQHKFDRNSVLVGHSAGGPLILAILNAIDTPIKQAVLVAGYGRQIGDEMDPVLQASYDWGKIGSNVSDITFINSDNDPWGCNDGEGRFMLEQIGKGQLIVMKGQGHMGSDTYKQPYKEFPLLLDIIG